MENDEEHINKEEVLPLKAIKAYAEVRIQRGDAEYNKGTILAKSGFAIDRLCEKEIIESWHRDAGEDLIKIHDCAHSKLLGRIYNDVGRGDDSIDAMLKWTAIMYQLNEPNKSLLVRICFQQVRDTDIATYDSRGIIIRMGWIMQCKVSVRTAFDALVEAMKPDNVDAAIQGRKTRARDDLATANPEMLKRIDTLRDSAKVRFTDTPHPPLNSGQAKPHNSPSVL